MMESEEIYNFYHSIETLRYKSTGKTPQKFSSYPNIPYAAFAGTILNGARGVWMSKKIIDRVAPEQKLELWSFEASPYSRVVRSLLCELELPYILHRMLQKKDGKIKAQLFFALNPGKYVPLKGGKREKILPVMQGKMRGTLFGRPKYWSEDV